MLHWPSGDVLIQSIATGLLIGGVYALMASGLTLIFGVMRVINIAHGALLVLGGYFAYWMFDRFGLDPLVSLILAVPVFFVLGLVMQTQLLTRVRSEAGFIVLATFALAIAMEGLMAGFWETTFRSVRTGYTGKVVSFDFPVTETVVRMPIVKIVGFGAAVVVLALLGIILARTNLGRAVRATMQNAEAAQLVGVNVARVKALTFGIAASTIAVGGAMFSLIWSFNASSHTEWISRMLVIVVLGGMGSLPGALIAGLMIGMVDSVAAVSMPIGWSPIVFLSILFVVLILRPQGLLGTRVRVT